MTFNCLLFSMRVGNEKKEFKTIYFISAHFKKWDNTTLEEIFKNG